MLHRIYEEMIVRATLDPAFGVSLLADPRSAALDAGYAALVAESLVGLSSTSLADFARALHQRIYGAAAGSDIVPAPNVAVANQSIRSFERTVG